MFSSELYKAGLFFLTFGAILDFMLIRWKTDIWLWARVELWEKIDSLQFTNYHQKVAKLVLRPIDSKWVEDYGSGAILTLSVFWSYLSARLTLIKYPNQVLVSQIYEASTYMLYFFVSALLTHMLMGVLVKYEKKYTQKLSNTFLQIHNGLIYSCAAVIVLGLMVIGLQFIFPPHPGWSVALLSICINMFFDGCSVYVTIKILRWIASGVGVIKGVIGPFVDVLSATIFLFLSGIGVGLAFSLVGVKPSQSATNAPISYLGAMEISVFLPTLLIAVIVFISVMLKISQVIVKNIMLYVVDLSADPNNDSHVKPFTMLGGMAALGAWAVHFILIFV